MHQNPTKINRTQARLYSAIVLLIGVVFVLMAPATGPRLHEWAGFLIIIPLLIHIIIDWKWIVTVSRRIFKKQHGQTRFNYYWDWLLFIMMTVAIVSGVMISEAALPAMGITIEIDPLWTGIHIISSRFLMMMLGVHIAMHWSWIVNALKRPTVRALTENGDSERPVDTNILLPMKSTIIPMLIIVLAAAVVILAVLPWADAQWADSRPWGFRMTVVDLYWVAVIMGIPALITRGILWEGRGTSIMTLVGIGLGIGVGAALDDGALGAGLGIALGAALGRIFRTKNRQGRV